MADHPIFGTAEDLAAFITARFFPIAASSLRRGWRHQRGLQFYMLNGKSVARFADALKIAEAMMKVAPPAPSVTVAQTAKARALRHGKGKAA